MGGLSRGRLGGGPHMMLASERRQLTELAQMRSQENIERAKIDAENRRAAAQRAQETRINNTNLGNPDGKFVTQGQYDSNPSFWSNMGYSAPQIGKPASGSGQVSPQPATAPATTGLSAGYNPPMPFNKTSTGKTKIYGQGNSYGDSALMPAGAPEYEWR